MACHLWAVIIMSTVPQDLCYHSVYVKLLQSSRVVGKYFWIYSLCALVSVQSPNTFNWDVTDFICLTNIGVSVQAQQDRSQLYFYRFLKMSDYIIHASTHNNGRPFIWKNLVRAFSSRPIMKPVRATQLMSFASSNDVMKVSIIEIYYSM